MNYKFKFKIIVKKQKITKIKFNKQKFGRSKLKVLIINLSIRIIKIKLMIGDNCQNKNIMKSIVKLKRFRMK